MRKARRVWLWAAVGWMAGCGGRYEVGLYPDDAGTTGGPTGPSSSSGVTTASTTGMSTTGTGGGAGGAPGTGGPVDPCVLTSMKACQTIGCHVSQQVSDPVGGNLHLDAFVLTTNFRSLVRPNYGDRDNSGCPPGIMNIIDTTSPERSMIYQKLADPVPCGLHMPEIGYPLKAVDKACVLSWINSVVASVGTQ